MSGSSASNTVVVHWPRFGPYHIARLRSADAALQAMGMQVVGLEVASKDSVYQWQQQSVADAKRCTVFAGRMFEEISVCEMCGGILKALNIIRPAAVATNGYSTADVWAVLAWCRLHHCPAILMTESKSDDAPRARWKERIKQTFIDQFSAALCGGTLQRAYLEQLGMPPDRIFDGYDAVDNDYFWRRATQIRMESHAYCSLPGLETPVPYFLAAARFVKRKNLDGLLKAYAEYRRRLQFLAPERQPWRLVIIGDGVERSNLQQLVRAERIEGVSFPGFCQIDELPIYYALAGAFIHSAYQDQWGLVVNEAMAAGLPVLVSAGCGCAPDLVCHGQNGFTFEPEDLSTLAALMDFVSSSRADLGSMGMASHRWIEQWGLERFAKGLSSALQVALRDKQKIA
jgi:glycosyltransferase involved in cell wall biosynthesis